MTGVFMSGSVREFSYTKTMAMSYSEDGRYWENHDTMAGTIKVTLQLRQ
jgi:hypothetical protein